MSDTISKIKLNGVTYTIDDLSKASIESVLEFGEITSENNSLLTFANSKLDELLNRINGSTKSQDFYECVSVNTSTKTWSGYKAILTNGVYSFEETVTEDLNYGMAFTPTIGAIYNVDATVVITALYKKADPITLNDTNCLIFIDGSSLSNQALAANKHEITFGNGVSLQDGYLNISNDESGQILTTAKSDGYGGGLNTWTWDYYFMADGSRLDCSGHSLRDGWTLESAHPGESLYFRGYSANDQLLGVTYNRNELIGLSMQYQNGILHVWNEGKYVGQCIPRFTDCSSSSFGIGCIADGDYDRMADKIKLFRFSNVARYTPGLDFDVSELVGASGGPDSDNSVVYKVIDQSNGTFAGADVGEYTEISAAELDALYPLWDGASNGNIKYYTNHASFRLFFNSDTNLCHLQYAYPQGERFQWEAVAITNTEGVNLPATGSWTDGFDVIVYTSGSDGGSSDDSSSDKTYVYTVSGFMPQESCGTFEGTYYAIPRPADASSEIPTTHKIYKNDSGRYMVCCSIRWSGWCLTNSIVGELASMAYAQGTLDLTEPPTSSEKTWYNTFDNSLLTVEKHLAGVSEDNSR